MPAGQLEPAQALPRHSKATSCFPGCGAKFIDIAKVYYKPYHVLLPLLLYVTMIIINHV